MKINHYYHVLEITLSRLLSYLRSSVNGLKSNFKKLNNEKNRYLVSFILLIVFALGWGILYEDDFTMLLWGIAYNIICFKLIIKIAYPRTLKKHVHPKVPFNAILKKHSKLILLSLVSVLVVSLLYVNMFSLTEKFALVVCDNYMLAMVVYLLFLSIAIVLWFYYGKQMWYNLKLKFKKTTYNRNNMKVLLFYRKNPQSRKDMVAWYLSGVSVFNNTPFIFYFLLGCSFRYSSGIECYMWFILCIVTALFVTLPSFRRYFFSHYTASSLRMLGWNGPETHGIRVGVAILGIGVSISLAHTFNGHIARENHRRQEVYEEGRIDKHNKRVDIAREKDPKGYDEGRYKYASLEYKPIDSTFWKFRWPGKGKN